MSFRIFAGNLAFQVTDEDLRTAFSKFGNVTFARVILDRDTGKSRGFGFVEIDGDAEGKRAIEQLDGHDLKGRELRLKEAEPRGPRQEGPRREGGPRPDGARRGPPRRDAGGPPPQPMPEDEDRRRERRAHAKKSTPGGEDRNRGAGQQGQQGRPTEKVRGGAKNRFRVDDDEDDDDIDLFGKYHEEEDYDVSAIEGVEIDDDEEPSGIRIDIDPKKKDE